MKQITDVLEKKREGVVLDMPRKDYDAVGHLNPSSLAAGLLDHIDIDPLGIKCAYEGMYAKSKTQASLDAMDRGTLAHMMLLQPERVGTDVAKWDGGTRTSAKEDKPATKWDEFRMANEGKLIVSKSDYDAVAEACRVFRFMPIVNMLLTDLDAEVAMFSEENGIYTKGLVDCVTRGVRKIIDLKTTERGITQKSVETTIRMFCNREKMAMYKRMYEHETGEEVVACWNLFLSMEPPYAVRAVRISEMALEWGERRMMAAIASVRECLEKKSWPVFSMDDVADVKVWELDEEIEAEEDDE